MKTWMLGSAALAAVAAMPAAAQELHMPAPLDGTLLEITAEGTTDRVPDIATVQAGVVTQALTAQQAMVQNNAQMTRVLAALRAAGVAERDIRTASVSLSPQYRHAENKPPVITGYQASNQVTVRFREIARAGSILDALVREGANSIDGPNLSIDKPDAALDEARTAAVTKARARAELYARAAGLRIDRILSIAEASAWSPPMPMNVRGIVSAQAGYADMAIVPGEQRVSVNVTVRYVLK